MCKEEEKKGGLKTSLVGQGLMGGRIFSISSRFGSGIEKVKLAGGFRSSISVEIFDQVFPDTVSTVFLGILGN